MGAVSARAGGAASAIRAASAPMTHVLPAPKKRLFDALPIIVPNSGEIAVTLPGFFAGKYFLTKRPGDYVGNTTCLPAQAKVMVNENGPAQSSRMVRSRRS